MIIGRLLDIERRREGRRLPRARVRVRVCRQPPRQRHLTHIFAQRRRLSSIPLLLIPPRLLISSLPSFLLAALPPRSPSSSHPFRLASLPSPRRSNHRRHRLLSCPWYASPSPSCRRRRRRRRSLTPFVVCFLARSCQHSQSAVLVLATGTTMLSFVSAIHRPRRPHLILSLSIGDAERQQAWRRLHLRRRCVRCMFSTQFVLVPVLWYVRSTVSVLVHLPTHTHSRLLSQPYPISQTALVLDSSQT